MSFPRQYTIRHLMILTTAIAVLLALAKYSPLVAIAAGPIVVGAAIGYRRSQILGGALVGTYFSFALIATLPMSLFIGPDYSPGQGDALAAGAVLGIVLVFLAFGKYAERARLAARDDNEDPPHENQVLVDDAGEQSVSD